MVSKIITFIGLYHRFGYKAPFIFCIVVAGVDFFLRLFMVEKKDSPPEWFLDEEEEAAKEISSVNSESNREAVCDLPTGEDNTEDNTVSLQEAKCDVTETKTKPKLSTWALLSHPRLLAAALLSFAYGTVFNVFEVK